MALFNPTLKGAVWKYGDHVDTDQIFPGKYLAILNPSEMAAHAMEGVPGYNTADKLKKGAIVVGGKNFGSGSSREHAPLALAYSGVQIVLAESFAQIFYRNAINIGLPVIEIPPNSSINQKDILQINLVTGTIENITSNTVIQAIPLTGLELSIIKAGGLIPFIRAQ